MTKDNLPKAIYEGTLDLNGYEIPCAVLDTGERVLSQRGVNTAFGRSAPSTSAEEKLPAILAIKSIKPFISNELMLKASEKKLYITKGNFKAISVPAEMLPEICDVWLKARDANALSQNNKTAIAADLLMRALAHIGIISLVDEATGYQDIREANALQKILDKFLKDEAHKWSKTFPDQFWIKLVKIKGYESYMALKRPAFVGHWVNDIVYARLAPGIKSKLKEINPRTASGNRKNKHHQHFTDDYGLPELKDHLGKVMVLMDASANKTEFERLLNRSLPKYGDTLELDLDNPN